MQRTISLTLFLMGRRDRYEKRKQDRREQRREDRYEEDRIEERRNDRREKRREDRCENDRYEKRKDSNGYHYWIDRRDGTTYDKDPRVRQASPSPLKWEIHTDKTGRHYWILPNGTAEWVTPSVEIQSQQYVYEDESRDRMRLHDTYTDRPSHEDSRRHSSYSESARRSSQTSRGQREYIWERDFDKNQDSFTIREPADYNPPNERITLSSYTSARRGSSPAYEYAPSRKPSPVYKYVRVRKSIPEYETVPARKALPQCQPRQTYDYRRRSSSRVPKAVRYVDV